MIPLTPPRHWMPPDPQNGPPPGETERAQTQDPEGEPDRSDPYEDLWDPDMDTRPERIRKSKGRQRPEARGRAGSPRPRRRETP